MIIEKAGFETKIQTSGYKCFFVKTACFMEVNTYIHLYISRDVQIKWIGAIVDIWI